MNKKTLITIGIILLLILIVIYVTYLTTPSEAPINYGCNPIPVRC